MLWPIKINEEIRPRSLEKLQLLPITILTNKSTEYHIFKTAIIVVTPLVPFKKD